MFIYVGIDALGDDGWEIISCVGSLHLKSYDIPSFISGVGIFVASVISPNDMLPIVYRESGCNLYLLQVVSEAICLIAFKPSCFAFNSLKLSDDIYLVAYI